MIDALKQLVERHRRRILRIARRADRDKHIGVVRENRGFLGQMQRLHKALAQPLEEEQRPAEEQHLALDLTPLRKTCDGLTDHRLENARRDILLTRALIEQRLDIGFGKHAAARGNCVQLLML